MKNKYTTLVGYYWWGKMGVLKRKTWLAPTLSTTDPTQTGLGSNPGLHTKKPLPHFLSHGTVRIL